MYLSEGAKLCIKQILMLWDELGHSPSFSEFDNDERTPRANSLAFYFGSYSDAIAASKPFYGDLERRKELEPKVTPVTPSALLPKGKKKGKNRNAAVQSALTSSVIPKTSQMPPKALETQESQKEPLKEPQKAPEPIITPPEPEKPEQEVIIKTEPAVKEEPEEPIVTVLHPQHPYKEVVSMNQTIVNYLKEKAVLVADKQFHEAMAGITPEGISAIESEGIAITLKAEVHVDDFGYETGKNLPIVSIFGRPALVKNGAVYEFPDEKSGTLYLVEREVAEAARDLGRSTDDLVYPIEPTKLDGIIYCWKLGKL